MTWCRLGVMLAVGGVLAGCQHDERVASPPSTSLSPPPTAALAAVPGGPLPAGWAWPFAPGDLARALGSHSLLRPFDVARVSSFQGTSPCAPTQVAPGVWVSTLCSALPKLAASPAVATRMRLGDDMRPATAAAVDLRASGLDGPVKDQQMVGVCWSFALSTLMDNALRRAGRQEVMAPLHIIAADTWHEIFQHGQSRDLVTEPSWPYDPPRACQLNEEPSERWCQDAYHVRPGSWRQDPALVAEVNQANANGVFRIAKIERLKTAPLDTEHVASILASGQAIYLGMQIDSNAWGHAVQGQIADWASDHGGGHAVVAVGHRGPPGQRQFLIHNSWGTTWADGGYAWISEAMVRGQTDEAFTVDVVGPRGRSLPTPAHPSSLPGPFGGLALPWVMPSTGGQGLPLPGGVQLPAGLPLPGGVQLPAQLPGVLPLPGGSGLPAPAPSSGAPACSPADLLAGRCLPACPPAVGGLCAGR